LFKAEKLTSINEPHKPGSDLSHDFRKSDYEDLGMKVPDSLKNQKKPSYKKNPIKSALLHPPKMIYNAGKTAVTKLYNATIGKKGKGNSGNSR